MRLYGPLVAVRATHAGTTSRCGKQILDRGRDQEPLAGRIPARLEPAHPIVPILLAPERFFEAPLLAAVVAARGRVSAGELFDKNCEYCFK